MPTNKELEANLLALTKIVLLYSSKLVELTEDVRKLRGGTSKIQGRPNPVDGLPVLGKAYERTVVDGLRVVLDCNGQDGFTAQLVRSGKTLDGARAEARDARGRIKAAKYAANARKTQ